MCKLLSEDFMRIFISAFLLVTVLLGVPGVGYAISEKDLPAWVPDDQAIRENMVIIINASLEYVGVKRASHEITRAWMEGQYVWMTVKRGALVTDIKIGEFENVADVRVKGGVLMFRYQITAPPRFSWAGFSLGAGVGIAVTSLIFAIARK
jgi:hypothetical protein